MGEFISDTAQALAVSVLIVLFCWLIFIYLARQWWRAVTQPK